MASVLSCPVQYRRPNGQHSLGLCDEHMGVGEIESARVCAHHISSIGGQTAGPIGLKMCTNTHWDYAIKIGVERVHVRALACACVFKKCVFSLNPRLTRVKGHMYALACVRACVCVRPRARFLKMFVLSESSTDTGHGSYVRADLHGSRVICTR
jgi:hypothetical protein